MNNLRQLRWPVVLAVLAVALGGLFGAGFVLKTQTVDQPLREMLARVEHVQSYSVQRDGDSQEITVRFGGSADLKTAYGQLDGEVKKVLKSLPYQIKVEDQRSPELEKTAARLDLYVQEALATGQFTAMADRVEAEASRIGATAEVTVDGQRVYVALQKGDAFLYSVVERSSNSAERPVARPEGGFGL